MYIHIVYKIRESNIQLPEQNSVLLFPSQGPNPPSLAVTCQIQLN